MTTVTITGGTTRVQVGGATKRITLDRSTSAAIANNRPTTRVVARNPAVSVASQPTSVTIGSAMGVQGPAGADGETEGATFNALAGETVHGLRVVCANSLGALFHPSLSTADHAGQVIGIATQSGLLGATVLVRVGGQMTEPSWSWTAGAVFCGTDGQLTQAPSASGWLLQVGRVVSPTTISVDIETPYYR